MTLKAIAFALFACIATHTSAQINTASAGTKQAGLYEISECRFPTALTFTRETIWSNGWAFPFMSRYVQFAGEAPNRMIGPNINVTGKNPEQVSAHGGEHYTNCTNGNPATQYQFMTFKLRTTGYFDTGVGNHIAVMLRSSITEMENAINKNYQGVGTAIFRDNGIYGERFNLKLGGKFETPPFTAFKFNDGATYEITIHAAPSGAAYAAKNLNTGARVPTTGMNFFNGVGPNNPELYFQGAAIAVLCTDQNSACADTGPQFRIDIWDINVGWFNP